MLDRSTSPWRPRAALAALSVGTFLYVTTETLPIGLLAPISHDLGVPPSRVGLLVTWYGLVVVLSSLPLTYLTRNVPRRLLLGLLLAGYVVAALASAVVDSYAGLLLARVATALGQSVFWSIVVPIAAGLFPVEVRGRVLAVVFAGGSLAAVVGVPLGAWVGQQLSWRWAFVALAGIGTLVLAAVTAWLPGAGPEAIAAGRGAEPDRRRFWALIAMTVFVTTGAFTFFTYLSPFLTDAVGLSAGLLSVVLLLRGIAGLAGVAGAGLLVDRRPRTAIVLPAALQVIALLLLFARPGSTVLAVTLVALTGYTFTAFTTPLSSRIMQVAPGRVDLASSGTSSAVNIGITAGAWLGSWLLVDAGARSTALAGALLTAAALALVGLDRPRPDSNLRPRAGTNPRAVPGSVHG